MTIHIYTAPNTRTRRMCPYHHHLCYGNKQEFYDTTRIFFDCGAMVDFGYGYYDLPPKKKCPHCRKHFRPLDMPIHLKESHLPPRMLL